MAPQTLQTSPVASDALLALLHSHLPHSFALLRRLQFSRIHPGPTDLILLASSSPTSFTAAYLDVHAAPETQMWLYSTLEAGFNTPDSTTPSEELIAEGTAQVRMLLRYATGRALEAGVVAVGVDGATGGVKLGALHEGVRRLVDDGPCREPFEKWLFRVEDLPEGPGDGALEPAMRWGDVRGEDVALIQSRTKYPKAESTLMMLPRLGIRLEDDTLVAWGFLGVDGTLSTLHCEEPYRGRGIAKALAIKLIKEHNGEFGDDGWCAADVFVDNKQSQGVCRSIGGKVGWRESW